MPRTLRFFITSIFLCAAFSASAQVGTDWELKAVEYERIAFSAEDPAEAAEALVQKAYCYRQCGRYAEAVATLSRISMYQLPAERRGEVLYEKELCSCLAGDYEGAVSYMEEAGESASPERLAADAMALAGCARWDESLAKAESLISLRYDGEEREEALRGLRELYSRKPELKTEKQAVLRSFLPPLGHLYSGHLAEGLAYTGLDAAAAGWIVWQCLGHNWVTGLLGGGVLLNAAFMGGMERSVELADEHNKDALAGFNYALRSFLAAHSAAE